MADCTSRPGHRFICGLRLLLGGAQLIAGCSHLARRLSGPALERVREGADLMKTEQPRDLGYMQLAVVM
jgi:hypothetical protein